MNEEFLKNNPIALRACLMYEYVKSDRSFFSTYRFHRAYNPGWSFFMYQEVCKVIGDDVMKFPEFDFWFHRFLNGEFDLTFERDKDKKIYELTDMPLDVMENIVEHLDFFDRLALEKTSRSLRTFIIHQKQSIKTVNFDIRNSKAGIQLYDDTDPDYDDGWCWKRRPPLQKFRKAYWEEATQGLKKILRYPKLYLDTLQAYFSWDDRKLITISSSLWKEFDTPTHQIHLKRLDAKVVSVKIIPKFLPYFTPGYLEKIEIDICDPYTPVELEESVGLEQWKQAKYFTFKNQTFKAPLRHLYHFKEFNVRLISLSGNEVHEMKEILFISPVFEKCSIAFDFPFKIGHVFGDAIPGSTNIYHYPIPDSNEYFEILVKMQNIGISRKKK